MSWTVEERPDALSNLDGEGGVGEAGLIRAMDFGT